jgi:DNA-directed DNA polymerase III PolC
MPAPCFTPLHVHSYYSLLEGVDSLDTLLARAAACGYQNLALTDSNNLYGAVAFVEATRKYGVRPILGACLRHGRQRCTALIAEETGYQSLCRILSRLHLQDQSSLISLLIENADGLHVLIDDLELLRYDSAFRIPHSTLREAFGDRLWLEVVRPPHSAARERALLEAGQRLGLRPVASVAAHFATPDGYPTFRLLTAVRQGILLDQVPARLSITPAHHLPEIEQVYQRFRDLPEAIVNTEQLAGQCRSDVLPRGIVLPSPRVPRAHDAFSYLQVLCERGLRRRVVFNSPHPTPPPQGGRGFSEPARVVAEKLAPMFPQRGRELSEPEREGNHKSNLPISEPCPILPEGETSQGKEASSFSLPPCGGGLGWGGAEVPKASTLVEASGRATPLTTHHSPLTTHSASLITHHSSLTTHSAARQRLDEELHIIRKRGLAGYFLVVRQIAREARRRRFSMALRGSAGNSLICYLLGITDVDPLRFDLPLERFLHAGRLDLPDIDLDFDWRERDEIIASVFERYGETHTAMISSHLFLQPRSAFREAAKIHGLSNEQTSHLIETLLQRVEGFFQEDTETGKREDGETNGQGDKEPRRQGEVNGVNTDLSASLSPRLLVSPSPPPGFPLEPPRWPRLLADARRLLGRPRHLSVHPGGIVITPGPIENYVPLQRAAKGVIITQFEKDAIEQIGLVKIDLLGNRALSTVSEALRRLDPVSRDIVSRSTEHHDESTLKLLQQGDTVGVNQLESPAMRHLLIQMRPRNMHDVIQALALIRPGAASIGAKEKFIRRRRDVEPVRHLHPSLEPLLHDSCGLMLYEDDALRVVQTLTGLSAPEADRFRKQITKSQTNEELEALSKAFLSACERNGIDRRSAEETWVNLAKFNSYSFCRSHSVSYGMIAWRAAYLKAHFPLVFWTAALNNNQGMYPRRVYVEAAKRASIPFFLPCVNCSENEFSIEGVSGGMVRGEWSQAISNNSPLTSSTGIRTGLSCIRSLDEASREAILEDRRCRGPYQSLPDLLRRVTLGPETFALLIQAGAFDFTGESRSALMLMAAIEEKTPRHPSFFVAADAEPWPYEWTPADYSQVRQWREEWDRLGFLAGPPLMVLFRPFLPKGLHDSRQLAGRIGRPIRLAGLVATGRHTETKNGEEMQFITIEDEWGLVDVTLFPRLCPPIPHLGVGPYLVEGEVDEQHGVLTVTARRFQRAIKRETLEEHSLSE